MRSSLVGTDGGRVGWRGSGVSLAAFFRTAYHRHHPKRAILPGSFVASLLQVFSLYSDSLGLQLAAERAVWEAKSTPSHSNYDATRQWGWLRASASPVRNKG